MLNILPGTNPRTDLPDTSLVPVGKQLRAIEIPLTSTLTSTDETPQPRSEFISIAGSRVKHVPPDDIDTPHPAPIVDLARHGAHVAACAAAAPGPLAGASSFCEMFTVFSHDNAANAIINDRTPDDIHDESLTSISPAIAPTSLAGLIMLKQAFMSPPEQAKRRCAAMTKKRLDIAVQFDDGVAALTRIHRSEVPLGAKINNTTTVMTRKRNGNESARWCIADARPKGTPVAPETSSPTSLASTVLLTFSFMAAFDWDHHHCPPVRPGFGVPAL